MSRKKLPIPYRYAIPAGIGLGLLWGLRTYLYFWTFQELDYFAWEKHVLIHVVNYLTWALLLPLVYYSVQQLYWRQSTSAHTWGLVILAGLVLSLAHEAISNVLYFGSLHLLGKESIGLHTLKHIVGVLPSAIITRLVEYGILYAILTAIEYQRRLRNQQIEMAQLESQLAGAQLSALRLQLQPHFLFNTLNTISALMEFDVKSAQRVVSRLGNLLRTVLEKDKRNLTELREEIAFIRSYLDIEQVRFQDRLQIDYQIDESVLDAGVPSLLLQPLVENAVKHGFANRSDEGVIEVKVERKKDRLLLSVSDDGYGATLSGNNQSSAGIGLKNVQERLELIFPKDHQFQIEKGKERGFSVLINIPYQKFSHEKDPHPGSR